MLDQPLKPRIMNLETNQLNIPSTNQIRDPTSVTTEEKVLPPARTTNCERNQADHTISLVKNLYLYIRKSPIKTEFKKIYINLLLFSTRRFLYLLVLFPKVLKPILSKSGQQKSNNIPEKTPQSKNPDPQVKKKKITHSISGGLNWFTTRKKKNEHLLKLESLPTNIIQRTVQEALCQYWNINNQMRRTRYEPEATNSEQKNQSIPIPVQQEIKYEPLTGLEICLEEESQFNILPLKLLPIPEPEPPQLDPDKEYTINHQSTLQPKISKQSSRKYFNKPI